ncbi:MAG: PilZ domain-containing protein [Candidatus Omnitrophota bacterium]
MKKIFLEIQYGKGKNAKGYILDISRGGIGLVCDQKITSKSSVGMKATEKMLPFLKGKVAYAVPRQDKAYKFHLGVKFIPFNKTDKQKLEKFIHKVEQRKAVRLSLI